MASCQAILYSRDVEIQELARRSIHRGGDMDKASEKRLPPRKDCSRNKESVSWRLVPASMSSVCSQHSVPVCFSFRHPDNGSLAQMDQLGIVPMYMEDRRVVFDYYQDRLPALVRERCQQIIYGAGGCLQSHIVFTCQHSYVGASFL